MGERYTPFDRMVLNGFYLSVFVVWLALSWTQRAFPFAGRVILDKSEAKELEKLLQDALLERARSTFGDHLDQDKSLAKISDIYLRVELLERRCKDLRAETGKTLPTVLRNLHEKVVCDSVESRLEDVRLAVVRLIVPNYDKYFSLFQVNVRFTPEAASLLLQKLRSGKKLAYPLWFTNSFSSIEWSPLRVGCRAHVDIAEDGDFHISYWMILAGHCREPVDNAKLDKLVSELLDSSRLWVLSRGKAMVKAARRPTPSVPQKRAIDAAKGTPAKVSFSTPQRKRKTPRHTPEAKLKLASLGVVFGLCEYAYGKSLQIGVKSEAVRTPSLDTWLSRKTGVDGLTTVVFGEAGYGLLPSKKSTVQQWFWSTGLRSSLAKGVDFPFFVRVGLSGYYVSETADDAIAKTSRAGALVGAGVGPRATSRISVELGVDFIAAKRLATTRMWLHLGLGL